MKIVVSACLAGERCRFDGFAKKNSRVADLVNRGLAIAGCPEVLGGLGTPRPAAEICGGDGLSVLEGKAKVMTIDGRDVTAAFMKGSNEFVAIAKEANCDKAILVSGSPACGVGRIFDGTFSGTVQSGDGVAAAALKLAGIEVEAVD